MPSRGLFCAAISSEAAGSGPPRPVPSAAGGSLLFPVRVSSALLLRVDVESGTKNKEKQKTNTDMQRLRAGIPRQCVAKALSSFLDAHTRTRCIRARQLARASSQAQVAHTELYTICGSTVSILARPADRSRRHDTHTMGTGYGQYIAERYVYALSLSHVLHCI